MHPLHQPVPPIPVLTPPPAPSSVPVPHVPVPEPAKPPTPKPTEASPPTLEHTPASAPAPTPTPTEAASDVKVVESFVEAALKPSGSAPSRSGSAPSHVHGESQGLHGSGLSQVFGNIVMPTPTGGLEPPLRLPVIDMITAPFYLEPQDGPAAKRMRMTLNEIPSTPVMDVSRSSLYMHANGCLAVLDVQGAFHRVGLLHGRPVWKSQSFSMVGSPQRTSFIWYPGHKSADGFSLGEGWAWSTNVPPEGEEVWVWKDIDMIAWISRDMSRVMVPWDGQEKSPVQVYALHDYYAKRCMYLESLNLALYAEKQALQEQMALFAENQKGREPETAMAKGGWKSKCCALVVAYEQGLWAKCEALMMKCFGCNMLCHYIIIEYTCLHEYKNKSIYYIIMYTLHIGRYYMTQVTFHDHDLCTSCWSQVSHHQFSVQCLLQ